MQQLGAASDQQRRVSYEPAVDMLRHNVPDFTVSWIQVGTILWSRLENNSFMQKILDHVSGA